MKQQYPLTWHTLWRDCVQYVGMQYRVVCIPCVQHTHTCKPEHNATTMLRVKYLTRNIVAGRVKYLTRNIVAGRVKYLTRNIGVVMC